MGKPARQPRTHTVTGRRIEPEYAPRSPRRPQNLGDAGVGIRLRGLEKRFGEVSVLKGIDLDLNPGEFVAIVGKSGCGKSTLLRLLAGLDAPTAGRIEFVDAAAKASPANARIVFQEPRLLPWASVAENVAVGLDGKATKAERRSLSLGALAEVQLEDRADEWPSRLSGGQRQRVALARALVSKPAFLALDEPLGALDALTRITMQDLVERVWLEQGFTALFVTHDVSEAVTLADRVIVLDQGRITLDVSVPNPRPRERGAADLAKLEARLLQAIFKAG
jgi:sulfonate transport system ATP-binding protein